MSSVNHITKKAQTVQKKDSYAVSKKKLWPGILKIPLKGFHFWVSILRYNSISKRVLSQDKLELWGLWIFLVPRVSSSLDLSSAELLSTQKNGYCRLQGTYWGAKVKVLKQVKCWNSTTKRKQEQNLSRWNSCRNTQEFLRARERREKKCSTWKDALTQLVSKMTNRRQSPINKCKEQIMAIHGVSAPPVSSTILPGWGIPQKQELIAQNWQCTSRREISHLFWDLLLSEIQQQRINPNDKRKSCCQTLPQVGKAKKVRHPIIPLPQRERKERLTACWNLHGNKFLPWKYTELLSRKSARQKGSIPPSFTWTKAEMTPLFLLFEFKGQRVE